MTTATTTGPARQANPFIPPNIPSEDGIPMETQYHRFQANLLTDSLETRWAGRKDFYSGGNMFVHYSVTRALNKDFRGPDFFVVLDVDHDRPRDYWASWDEEGRLPDVIVELLSESTEHEDRTRKKDVYQKVFHTHEYFLYRPGARDVEGFRLGERYLPVRPDERGWLWSEKLDCWLGFWTGPYLGLESTWLRMFEKDGTMVLTDGEREKARADAAEAELARLRAELARRNGHGKNGSAI